MKYILIMVVKFYKVCISPLKPASCRFYPTCSDYAIQSLEKYGVIKGGLKTIYRIARCHPFNPGGFDPVK